MPDTVEEYLAALTADQRVVIEDFRRTTKAAAPDATETIAYDMPALRTADGGFLLSYGAYKSHYSLFPASEAVQRQLGKDVTPYVAGRGTIRFPSNRPVPWDLVTRIVKVLVAERSTKGG